MSNRIRGLVHAVRERVPRNALVVIASVVTANVAAWIIVAVVLVSLKATSLTGTAAVAYSLGLRHALDADHISAIDLVTRRLVGEGQSPATVGTFFSLGHSTIVIVTSLVVAATSASVSDKFGGISRVGGIVGTSVSAGFLLVLGGFNTFTLVRLVRRIRAYVAGEDVQAEGRGEGVGDRSELMVAGPLSKFCRKLFVLIDRPWKIYPLGVLFGLGFDTSSEIALLGISAVQAARGTSLYLILVFPLLFTCGMCLLDTVDGALMMSLYTSSSSSNTPSPLKYAYYSGILTGMTSVIAIVVGTIQVLSVVVAVKDPSGAFWDGVRAAGESFDVIGGGIVGAFALVAVGSVWAYPSFAKWAERERNAALESRRPSTPESVLLTPVAVYDREGRREPEELDGDKMLEACKDGAEVFDRT